jgi:hypothetical protein
MSDLPNHSLKVTGLRPDGMRRDSEHFDLRKAIS